jgi:hypothetical protein
MTKLRIVGTNARGMPVGTSHHWCKFSDAAVAHALQLHARGFTTTFIARQLGASLSIVSLWVRGLRRKPPTSIRVKRIKPPSADQQSAVPPTASTTYSAVRSPSRNPAADSDVSDLL